MTIRYARLGGQELARIAMPVHHLLLTMKLASPDLLDAYILSLRWTEKDSAGWIAWSDTKGVSHVSV